MNQWRKGIAAWKVKDQLYISIPFTWLIPEAEKMAKKHKGKVYVGGPAVDLFESSFFPWAEIPGFCPYDTLSFHNPLATFTTRGCPNGCPFCAVPKIEGNFRELETWKPAPIVCDNNLLASSMKHFQRVIDSLRPFYACDFNQGLDARLLNGNHISGFQSLNHPKIRFSFDHVNLETTIHDAIKSCQDNGLKDLGVYVLIGFKDTPADAHYRLEKVREWGVFPNPSRYQPLDTLVKNSYVAPGWTEKELRKTMKYYYRLGWLGNVCSYDDFNYLHEDEYERLL